MVIKYTIEKTIKLNVANSLNAKLFMESIVEKYAKFHKVGKGHYLSLIKKMVYDGVSGVHEHITKVVLYYNKLKSMNVDQEESFLI